MIQQIQCWGGGGGCSAGVQQQQQAAAAAAGLFYPKMFVFKTTVVQDCALLRGNETELSREIPDRGDTAALRPTKF